MKIIKIYLSIFIFFSILFILYFVTFRKEDKNKIENQETVLLNKDIKYVNQAYDFSLSYPKNYSLKEYDEGGNSKTFKFSDKNDLGFQIFITPYIDEYVTSDRIAMDIPGGIDGEPKEIVVGDNIRAILFYGKENLIGETCEVWMIHKGFLYQITSYKDYEVQLSNIISTWKWLTQ